MSKRFTLNFDDLKKWGKNALIFLAPALVVFFGALQSGKTFPDAFVVLELWLINLLVDLLRKFVASK